ncbi:ionotropic receptor 75a-like isoform X2 [Diabrotica virgifera virgifera]|nr:ionotropic receptor 75a-like isoform X2 [Diabrotica virgifera virgifera]
MSHYLIFFVIDIKHVDDKFEKLMRITQSHLGIVLDGDCKNWTSIINQETDKKYFYETYHWLVTSTSENVTNDLSQLKLNINSDMHLVTLDSFNETNEAYTIYDVYNPASDHGGEFKMFNIGFYNENVGYVLTNFENKYWRRRNMTGTHFKSAVVVPVLNQSLHSYLASDDNRQIDSQHRFQAVTVQHCRQMYNFSLKMQRTNSWGYIQDNGRFDGLVSLLERRLIDFGSSPLLFKLDRMPFVDYGYGNWILKSFFIYQKPKVTASSYEIFLRPLETNVWLLIILTVCVILILMKIVFSSEMILLPDKKVRVEETNFSFLVLFAMGAFCQQGAACSPFFFSSRILAFFVFLFSILIYQFYSASIVSYLLLDPPRTIFNLKDLTESQLKIGVEDILIDRNYFVQTTDPDAIELFEVKIKNSNNNSGFYSPTEGLELVRQGGFAFHVETSTAYPIIEETFSNQEICELEQVQMYRTQPMHTNLQKNSPFREMMNYCMFKQMENGNIDRLRKHWDARQPTCIEGAKKQEFNVSFKEFSCGPVAVGLGVLVGVICLSIEYLKLNKNKILHSLKNAWQFKNKGTTYPFVN